MKGVGDKGSKDLCFVFVQPTQPDKFRAHCQVKKLKIFVFPWDAIQTNRKRGFILPDVIQEQSLECNSLYICGTRGYTHCFANRSTPFLFLETFESDALT